MTPEAELEYVAERLRQAEGELSAKAAAVEDAEHAAEQTQRLDADEYLGNVPPGEYERRHAETERSLVLARQEYARHEKLLGTLRSRAADLAQLCPRSGHPRRPRSPNDAARMRAQEHGRVQEGLPAQREPGAHEHDLVRWHARKLNPNVPVPKGLEVAVRAERERLQREAEESNRRTRECLAHRLVGAEGGDPRGVRIS